MSGGVSRFLFSIPQKRNRLKYPPVAKILSRILIRQTLPFWQCIQILARSISGRADDALPQDQTERINSISTKSQAAWFQNHFFLALSFSSNYLSKAEGQD